MRGAAQLSPMWALRDDNDLGVLRVSDVDQVPREVRRYGADDPARGSHELP